MVTKAGPDRGEAARRGPPEEGEIMASRVWAAGLAAAMILAAAGWGCSRPGPAAREKEVAGPGPVGKALADLTSPDELVVRAAIRTLGDLAPGENEALDVAGPLAAVLNNRDRDLATRVLAPGALARLARGRATWAAASPILAPVIAAMMHDPSDEIRSSAALALADSGWQEAAGPLETVSLSDESLLTRATARQALMHLTQGAYHPPSAEAFFTSAGAGNGAISRLDAMARSFRTAEADAAPGPACVSAEEARWLRQHVIFLDPARRPPTCGASAGPGVRP